MLKKSLMVSTIALVLIACGSGSDEKKTPTAEDIGAMVNSETNSTDLNGTLNGLDDTEDDTNVDVGQEINKTNDVTNDINMPDLNTTLKKGYLVDAPISGVAYACGTIDGFTTDTGEFSCEKTPVEFTIGSYYLGTLDELTVDGIVYPQDLIAGVDRNNTDDERVIKMIRLLQSLDDDGNISEIIKIDQNAIDRFDEFGKAVNGLDLYELVDLANKDLVERDEAVEHLIDNMIENVLGEK